MNEPIARTMTAQITSRIRAKILTGAYAPGTQLLQDSIAAEFGVSKIPVREALVQLKSAGLVDIFAHRGFQVRPVSAAEVQEVFNLRLAIEPQAVAKWAKLASAADRGSAKAALIKLNRSLVAGELQHSGDLNSEFHLSLIVPHRQPATAEVLYRLHTIAQRYVCMHLEPKGRIKRATREHIALYEAWQAGKSREASRLTQAHIEETRDELSEVLRP
ncbi:MAG TPA: GntR family transcriptional regulator [Steroidobacteraceae bacterium]|jgi:DNA-binding GntR family transcriptional regulator|nr:GntR family transcriptional regulator [Steroidobacteraceae bacterium]